MSLLSSGTRAFPVLVAVIVALSLVAIPLVVVLGTPRDTATNPATDPATVSDGGAEGVEKLSEPADRPATVRKVPLQTTEASQLSFHRLSDGYHAGTASERYARPALSLIKLYIAAYVIEHGTLGEQYEAIAMISSSDDRSAEKFHRAYPEAIPEIATQYGLTATRAHEKWGRSVTSTYDAVHFIAQLLAEDPTHPILVAMAEATPIAADGYGQDFGTSVLPGVIGTKWGWSDARDLHSSVSFGENYVAAAAVTGTADDLTKLVEKRLIDEVRKSADSTASAAAG